MLRLADCNRSVSHTSQTKILYTDAEASGALQTAVIKLLVLCLNTRLTRISTYK
nr:MAG TPA: hypothetical protein [Caudoviricetes sp.]